MAKVICMRFGQVGECRDPESTDPAKRCGNPTECKAARAAMNAHIERRDGYSDRDRRRSPYRGR